MNLLNDSNQFHLYRNDFVFQAFVFVKAPFIKMYKPRNHWKSIMPTNRELKPYLYYSDVIRFPQIVRSFVRIHFVCIIRIGFAVCVDKRARLRYGIFSRHPSLGLLYVYPTVLKLRRQNEIKKTYFHQLLRIQYFLFVRFLLVLMQIHYSAIWKRIEYFVKRCQIIISLTEIPSANWSNTKQ